MDMIEKVAKAWASIDGKIEPFERELAGMDYDDPAYTGHYEGYMAEAKELLKRSGVADLIERQTEMFDRLDAALCQFLNNAGDEYDPREWVPSVKRDLRSLAQVYNDCHKVGVMDLSRSAARLLTSEEGE